MSPNSWFSQPMFLPGGNPDTFNEPTLPYPGQLGNRFEIINPPRQASDATDASEEGRAKGYQLVGTDSTMAVAPYDGATAWWANQAAYRVTTTVTTLGRGRVAGVFKMAVTAGNFCCIGIKGPHNVKFVDAPVSAPDATGKLVIPSATNSKADCLAAGSAATYPIMGRSIGALQGGTAVALVDLDIPDVY